MFSTPYTYKVSVHRSCVCNEMASLRNRHLLDRRQALYNPAYIHKSIAPIKRYLIQNLNPTKITKWDVVKSYTGAKRRSYAKAYNTYLETGFNEKYARVKMFVKPDKYDAVKVLEKAPRAIQYRDPIYNLCLAQYLKPLEHDLYNLPDKDTDMRWCAKGLNNPQRAALIRDASYCYEDPVYLLMDHAKFDSSVTSDHLKECANMYTEIMPCKFLRHLLKLQIHNKGRTKGGILYSVVGTRMSGDYNTALDNSTINYFCLKSYLKNNRVKGHIIVDGDDSVVVINREDLHKLLADKDHFKRFGFETEMQVVYELADVEFCRSKLLITPEHAIMAREPKRAISNLCFSLKEYHGKAKQKYLVGNALCELHRSVGSPILYKFAEAILQRYGREDYIMDTETRYKFDMYKVSELFEPTEHLRLEYYKSFGISPSDQVRIENELANSIKGAYEVPFDSLPNSVDDIPLY